MPGGNGMGPMGMGPMTGRAAGFCAGYGMPGYANPMPGRGFGMGFGRGFGGRGGGRGFRNRFFATGMTGWQRAATGWAPAVGMMPPESYAPGKEQVLAALKSQAEYTESALGDIRKRIEELESAPEDK
ncbi:MAG: DUF5320 domain-containing protein [Kiritimatiellae bacterium]|nr:DUF5320 domain-containing protein [Kiritimatiellia bacterium]